MENNDEDKDRFKKRYGQSYEEGLKRRKDWYLFKNKLYKSLGFKSNDEDKDRFEKRYGQSYEEELKERTDWYLFKNKLYKSRVKSRPSLLGLTIYVLTFFLIIYGVIKLFF